MFTFGQLVILTAILLLTIILLSSVVALFSYMYRTNQIEKLLVENGFYINDYKQSIKKLLIESVKLVFEELTTPEKNTTKYFAKIQARTLKNKSIIIVQEKLEHYPFYQIAVVLKDPKVYFPSFKLTRDPYVSVKVPKKVLERDVSHYYMIRTKNWDIVTEKLQTYKMKMHYRKIPNQVFEVDFDQKLQTLTVISNKYKTNLKEVIRFVLTLDEELEDYKAKDLDELEQAEEEAITLEPVLKKNIKIYNAISLVKLHTIHEKCVICWSKIDYLSDTLLFECCTGYTHLDHGRDWIHEKEKCPKCGTSKPFTIQLPTLLLEH